MSDYKTQRWANGRGRLGGHATHLRKNMSLRPSLQRTHPYCVILNLIYHERAPDGLPGDEQELYRLDRAEEALADRFVSECNAHFAVVVTGDGTRDLFFFLPRSTSRQQIAQIIQAVAPEVDFDFSLHHDPAWRPYHDLMPT